MVQEAAKVWLHCPLNRDVAGFGTVAELYLLHVLVPLGHKDEAVELIVGEVGSCAFTEDQRQTALDVVEETERQNRAANRDPVSSPNAETTVQSASTPGAIFRLVILSWECNLSLQTAVLTVITISRSRCP